MLKPVTYLLVLLFISSIGFSQEEQRAEDFKIVYTSPMDGSNGHPPGTQILLKSKYLIENELFSDLKIRVYNENGQLIPGEVRLIDPNTINFRGDIAFTMGETVSVEVLSSNRKAAGGAKIHSFQFRIRDAQVNTGGKPVYQGSMIFNEAPLLAGNTKAASSASNFNELPDDFPTLNISISNNPEHGNYFMAGLPIGPYPRIYMCIIDTNGMPIFYQRLPNRAFDFRKQTNGQLTYYSGTESKFRVLDSAYRIVSTLEAANGYVTDSHELIIEDDGSYWLLSLDVQQVDMSQIVPGGNPNANVSGNIIQHIDIDGNVLFQWRSWDHMEITDCDTRFVNLTAPYIDYVHANAISFDSDGNILLSSRHMNEITKIDAVTGNIIWRWGGNKNQFSFQPDDEGFFGQHSIEYQEDSDTYTLFDNGNWHLTPKSRGMEYQLNQIGLSCNLIALFDKNEPLLYANAMGHTQRLDNGNTVVGWAGNEDFYVFTEYNDDGQEVFEIICPDTAMVSYRVFKFDWQSNRFRIKQDSLDFEEVEIGDSLVMPLEIINPLDDSVSINGFYAKESVFSVQSDLPFWIGPNESKELHIVFKPTEIEPYSDLFYVFHATDTSRIAQTVTVSGGGLLESETEYQLTIHTQLSIFPNPAKQSVTIATKDHSKIQQIQIFNASGVMIVSHKQPASESVVLNIKSLVNGIYTVVGLSEGKKKYAKLLVH